MRNRHRNGSCCSLGDLPRGKEARIRGFECDAAQRRKFISMGLVPSRQIRILGGHRSGPQILECGGARIALNGSLLRGILIDPDR